MSKIQKQGMVNLLKAGNDSNNTNIAPLPCQVRLTCIQPPFHNPGGGGGGWDLLLQLVKYLGSQNITILIVFVLITDDSLQFACN